MDEKDNQPVNRCLSCGVNFWDYSKNNEIIHNYWCTVPAAKKAAEPPKVPVEQTVASNADWAGTNPWPQNAQGIAPVQMRTIPPPPMPAVAPPEWPVQRVGRIRRMPVNELIGDRHAEQINQAMAERARQAEMERIEQAEMERIEREIDQAIEVGFLPPNRDPQRNG